jgi:hypothetical protein
MQKNELIELETIKTMLMPDENVELMITQRRLAPGGALIYPRIVVATNKRVIIESRMPGRKDFEIIAYRAIRNVKLEHGLVSSTVVMESDFHGTEGAELSQGHGIMEGLRYNDAIKLVELINRKVSEYASHGETYLESRGATHQDPGERAIHCIRCGAKNGPYANYCSNCGAKL